MKWAVVALLFAACQRGDAGGSAPAPQPERRGPVGDAYRADITSLCDCVRLSGADQVKGDRSTYVAIWLGSALKTDDSRQFLASIQPLEGDAKANALDAEAHRVGLTGCALSSEWRTPK